MNNFFNNLDNNSNNLDNNINKYNKKINELDPYKLFGITTKSTLKELKKKYYKLALLCHPDKGGSDKDMIIIYNSYLYIKLQIENINKSNKNIEKYKNINFDYFIQKYMKKPPPFYEIWIESEDYQKHLLFNKEFEKIHFSKKENISNGYGFLMEKKTKFNNRYMENYCKFIISFFSFNRNVKLKIYYYLFYTKNIFQKKCNSLIVYSNNLIHNYKTLDNKPINDYSGKLGNIKTYDYAMAYSNTINNLLNIKKSSKNINLDELILQRKNFEKELKKNLINN